MEIFNNRMQRRSLGIIFCAMCCSIGGALAKTETTLMLPCGVQENCSTITIHVRDSPKPPLLRCCCPRKSCAHVVRKEALDRVTQAKDTEAEKAAACKQTAAPHQQTGHDYYRVVAPKSKEGIVLIFPSDGSQPTTGDAEIFACADADSLGNAAITDFYVRLFGGGDGSVQDGGWDKLLNQTAPILRVSDEASNSESFCFWPSFKQIASTRSGRLLLYRLLIEIWRVTKQGPLNTAIFQNGEQDSVTTRGIGDVGTSPGQRDAREYCRSLLVYGPDTPPKGTYYLPAQESEPAFLVIQESQNVCYSTAGRAPPGRHGAPVFFTQPPPATFRALYLSALVYHELLHWFHQLRNSNRFAYEATGQLKVEEGVDPCSSSPIIRYYWGGLHAKARGLGEWLITMSPWLCSKADRGIDVEEIRTILGASPRLAGYLEGDDLSENLYRTELKLPIRFGHDAFCFFEDEQVIQKALEVCDGALANSDRVPEEQGLGACSVPRGGGIADLLFGLGAQAPAGACGG